MFTVKLVKIEDVGVQSTSLIDSPRNYWDKKMLNTWVHMNMCVILMKNLNHEELFWHCVTTSVGFGFSSFEIFRFWFSKYISSCPSF